MAKLSSTYSALCWRRCCPKSNLFHIFWSCKNIHSFWRKVFQILSNISRALTTPNPGLAILNLRIDCFPSLYRKIIANLLLSTKLTINRNWKKVLAPKPSEAVHTIHQHYVFERLVAVRSDTLSAFGKAWKPWLTLYNAWIMPTAMGSATTPLNDLNSSLVYFLPLLHF